MDRYPIHFYLWGKQRAVKEAVCWLQMGVPQKIIQWQYSQTPNLYMLLCLKSLQAYTPKFKLRGLRRQITIQWIPGHSDILENKMADSEIWKKTATTSVLYTAICTQIRHLVKDPPFQNERTAEIYTGLRHTKAKEKLTWYSLSLCMVATELKKNPVLT